MNEFGAFACIGMELHPGKHMLRVRRNKNVETFTTRQELSYAPSQNNLKYQRASTPNQTMFYASILPANIKEGELKNERVIATLEGTELLRNDLPDGEYKLTFSKWIVTKKIELFAVCYHKEFTVKSSHTQELYDAYHKWIKTIPEDLKTKSIEITEYLAAEFAKNVKEDYEYMISAIFTRV